MIERDKMSEKEIRDWYVSKHGLEANDDGTKDYFVHKAFLKAWDEQRPHGEWKYEPKLRLVDETDDGAIYETAMKCFCSACGADFGFQKVDDAFCKYCGSDNRKREGSNTKCEFANKCGISKACERGGVIKDTCPFIKKEGEQK